MNCNFYIVRLLDANVFYLSSKFNLSIRAYALLSTVNGITLKITLIYSLKNVEYARVRLI